MKLSAGVLTLAIALLQTDRFRLTSSTIDDVKSWLTSGGVSRVQLQLDRQMEGRRLASDRQREIRDFIRQLVQEKQRPLMQLMADGSIEHIYPQRVDNKFKDDTLEPLKNTLGNLTILDPGQNNIGGNDPFEKKKPLYEQSSVLLTRDLAKNQVWTEQEITTHKNLLIDVALKVFCL